MESTIQTTQRSKKKKIYITLGVLFGYLGLHNFYIGQTNAGLLKGLVTCFLWFTVIIPLIVWMWSIYEILTVREDFSGHPLK
jgi:TM2 domain-containing membrane protein YozV